jgi:hypothetical protein
MPRPSILPALLLAGLTVAACGGEAMEEAPAAEMQGAAAPAMATAELSCYLARGTMAESQERPSPLQETRFQVGSGDALLCYGAPSANEREVMGQLVPFGDPWRMGANEATALHLAGSATIGGVAVQAGSYSLFAIPGADAWEVFVNSNFARWGIPIDETVRSTDLGSFTATPEMMGDFVETLRYRFEGGELLLEWENTRVRIPVS